MLDFLLGHHTTAYTYTMIFLFVLFLFQTAIVYPKLKKAIHQKAKNSAFVRNTGALVYFSYTLLNSTVFLVLGGLTIASLSYF